MAMDQAFQTTRQAGMDDVAQGVPGAGGSRPGWLLPLVIGVAALVVGGGVTLLVMMAR